MEETLSDADYANKQYFQLDKNCSYSEFKDFMQTRFMPNRTRIIDYLQTY